MNLVDFETLEAAQAYVEGKGRVMSPDIMLSYITSFSLVDALIRNPISNEGEAVQAAFQFGSEFNFIVGHPQSVTSMLDTMVLNAEVPIEFKNAVTLYCNSVFTKPFEHATREQWLAVRQPASWVACDHGELDYLASASPSDSFDFLLDLAELTKGVSIRVKWSTVLGGKEYLSARSLTITGKEYLSNSRGFIRANMDLPRDAAILKFEYLGAYEGAVTSLSVSR